MEAYREAGWSFCFAVRSGLNAPDFLTARCKSLGIQVDGIVEQYKGLIEEHGGKVDDCPRLMSGDE